MESDGLDVVDEPLNVVSGSRSHGYASVVVMIDTRACVVDGIAQSVRHALSAWVTVVESVGDLVNNSVEVDDNPETMIVYCDGAVGDQEAIDRDLCELRKNYPSVRLLLLTDRLQKLSLDIFYQRIVNGIIPSSYTTDQLVACMSTVLSGVPFLPPELMEKRQSLSQSSGTGAFIGSRKLTPRQQQIMQYIVVGRSNKYIAAELSLCESTVKVHVHEVMKRLGATSRTHASYILANDSAME